MEFRDFRRLALDHASKGYYVFPVGKEKVPYKGLKDWEGNASTAVEMIHEWWDEHPGALPAVAPGRTNLAVIDLDRHPDSPSGFISLKKLKPELSNPFMGKSLSGNGIHLWYPEVIGSSNNIYPGIDRKAQGGYVVAPYKLPALDFHTAVMPEEFKVAGGNKTDRERQFMTDRELDLWMLTFGDGPVSAPMQNIVSRFQGSGNEQMSRSLAAVSSLAAKGFTGAFHAINKMLEIWLGGHHSSGDPEREFHASLRSAIERFGRDPDALDEVFSRWQEITAEKEETYVLNEANLHASLDAHLERVCPDWVERRSMPGVRTAYRQCMEALQRVTSPAREDQWLDLAKKKMNKALGVNHV